MPEMQEVFMNGFMDELEKLAGRTGATILGGAMPIASGLAAEEGKGWRSTGGAMLGSLVGAGLGSAVGGKGARLARMLGAIGGGAGGAYLAHGKDTKKKKRKK